MEKRQSLLVYSYLLSLFDQSKLHLRHLAYIPIDVHSILMYMLLAVPQVCGRRLHSEELVSAVNSVLFCSFPPTYFDAILNLSYKWIWPVLV